MQRSSRIQAEHAATAQGLQPAGEGAWQASAACGRPPGLNRHNLCLPCPASAHLRLLTRRSGRPEGCSGGAAVSPSPPPPAAAGASPLPPSGGLGRLAAKAASSAMLLVLLPGLCGVAGSSGHSSSSAPWLPALHAVVPSPGSSRPRCAAAPASHGSTAGECSSAALVWPLPPLPPLLPERCSPPPAWLPLPLPLLPARCGPLPELPLCRLPCISRAWLCCRQACRGARCSSSASRNWCLRQWEEPGGQGSSEPLGSSARGRARTGASSSGQALQQPPQPAVATGRT